MQIKPASRERSIPESNRHQEPEYSSEPASEARDELDGYRVRNRNQPSPAQVTETPEQPAPPAQPTRTESVIDRHSAFAGRFETEHDLRIDGKVSGEILCRGLFTVQKDAIAKVKVQSRDGHIKGRFEGDIVCSGKLLLAATGQIVGTVKAASLVVEEGASISGTVETAPHTKEPAARPPSTAETAPESENAPRPQRRDLPTFAIVASDDRVTADQH